MDYFNEVCLIYNYVLVCFQGTSNFIKSGETLRVRVDVSRFSTFQFNQTPTPFQNNVSAPIHT